jgi:magnesium transporter
VIAGLENDIDEIQDQLFGDNPDVSKRIYELLRPHSSERSTA